MTGGHLVPDDRDRGGTGFQEHRRGLIGGDRAVEVEALGHVATQLASHADLLGALDPLGHHGHVGPMKGYNQADLFGRGDEGPGPTMPEPLGNRIR